MVQRNQEWLESRLQQAASICNQPVTGDKKDAPLWLGIDLGTCDVVSMVVNAEGQPVAVCLDWADVVRDGVVWDFFGAVTIVNKHLDTLEKQLGFRFDVATTSFPPGTDPRISVNVLESAGLTVSKVLDEPSAVADMMGLDKAAVVDIGGGTTGIAIVQKGEVVRSGDEATGGHHISLTLAGNQRIELEVAEQMKRERGESIWPVIRPVYEKMTDIVEHHIRGEDVTELWLAGGSCMQPGVQQLFQARFPHLFVVLPQQSIFMTPLAIAVCGVSQGKSIMPDNKLPADAMQSAIYQALDLVNARQVREFSVPPTTLIGPGAVGRSGDVLAERGIKHVFIMVDGMLLQAGLTDVLERNLTRSGIAYEIWSCPPGEPMDKDVFKTVEHLLKVKCDGIIALGGGSVLDAAKAVAVLAANPGLPLANLMPGAALNPRLPFIAIPTTAGTGSEATNVSVIIEEQNHIKQVLAHSQLLPDLAIIDACLTLGVPPHITAMTGIDALTHAIEAYVASNVTPLTQALALRAITMISHALPVAVGQGHDIKAREDMMLASYMAGMAFSNAGLGLCHAMAHQIGAAYNIPHGKANAIMLPWVMRFNRLVCKQAYSEIGHALTQRQMTDIEAIEAVEQLISDVELAQTLPSLGGKREDFDGFAKAALQDICIKTNPRAVTAAQIAAIYESA